jgi:hypothetical protein
MAVEALLPIHNAPLLSRLKFSGKKVSLLINFNDPSPGRHLPPDK